MPVPTPLIYAVMTIEIKPTTTLVRTVWVCVYPITVKILMNTWKQKKWHIKIPYSALKFEQN